MKLLISLGHNSSAILVDKYKVVCGYEEERLSKVKSDSSYPKLAIEEIIKNFPTCKLQVTQVLVSHWFWIDGKEMEESKYWLPKHISARFPNAKVTSVDTNFTHHDAHAYSVWGFSATNAGLTIVADGFGTNGETVSVYRDGVLLARHYDVSLGLLYQNMTSHLGMKENQDEYKMLGLETHAENEPMLNSIAQDFSDMLNLNISMYNRTSCDSVKGVIDYNKQLFERLKYSLSGHRSYNKAYVVQRILELSVDFIIDSYIEPTDKVLQFSGGIFYNVKLNNTILNRYADDMTLIEFMPLAGDQGAALGMADVYYEDLFWGIRNVNKFEVAGDSIFIMKGNMEFGPRALGNTSCIASPTAEATASINKLNGRPNIMPMAPMINSSLASKYCKHVSKLGRCKHYMICATDWLGPIDEFRGVLHKKPFSDVYTCRPQVVDNEHTIERGIVINTSLNAHGQPILFDYSDYKLMEIIHAQNNEHS